MASQESISSKPENTKEPEENKQAEEEPKSTENSPDPKANSRENSKNRPDPAKNTETLNTNAKDSEISKRKHDKLVKKAKRLNEQDKDSAPDAKEEEKAKTKHKVDKPPLILPWTKINSAKDKDKEKEREEDATKGKENLSDKQTDQYQTPATKDSVKIKKLNTTPTLTSTKIKLRTKPPTSPKKPQPSKDHQDTREETPEEKGHNKVLIDSVYHKMELQVDSVGNKVKKDPAPMTAVKYNNYDEVAERVHDQVNTLVDSLHEIFQLYKPNEIMLSFNGGKDCTVVLHLLHTFYQSNSCLKHIKMPALYITDPDAFEEVDEFVADCEKLYNIDLIKKPGPIKKALEEICQEKPYIKAVFMGCRRTDPYCQDLKMMQPTDAGWPPLMRINPIIDWKCRDVWQYLYMYNVPHCSLYQKGYTSIGNKKNTKPNPYLKVIDAETGSVLDYRPGHELIDNDDLERAGRIKSTSANSQQK